MFRGYLPRRDIELGHHRQAKNDLSGHMGGPPTPRFRTDRAGLSKSRRCIGKPLPAAALTIKGYLAHWQTEWLKCRLASSSWLGMAINGGNGAVMSRRRKRRAIALGRRA